MISRCWRFSSGDDVNDFFNNLTGKVLKVLRHHDGGQMFVNFFTGLIYIVNKIHDVPLSDCTHRIGHNQLSNSVGFCSNKFVVRLSLIHVVENFLCSLTR